LGQLNHPRTYCTAQGAVRPSTEACGRHDYRLQGRPDMTDGRYRLGPRAKREMVALLLDSKKARAVARDIGCSPTMSLGSQPVRTCSALETTATLRSGGQNH
jgi:hypothetical protein